MIEDEVGATRRPWLAWVAAAALVAPASGWAVSTETQDKTTIEEITVTARHRQERVQDVPIPVSVVSAETLEAEHLDRVSDYAAKIPNFQAALQNTRVSTLTVRGLGANASSDGSEGSVGLIVDNVFFTHPGFAWLDFVDLESVQLARGPQGTLLGKNTTLGALVVTTQKPSFTPGAQFSLSALNRDRYQFRGNLTGPLIGDTLAGRLTVYRDDGDGWITNRYNGDELLDTGRWAARGQLLLMAGPLSNRLIVERYQTREFNNWYAPLGDVTAYSDGAARDDAWETRLRQRFGYDPRANYGLDAQADLDNQQKLESHTTGISNQADWQFDGGHVLTSVSAWRQLYFRPHNDYDWSPFEILRYGYDVDVDQYSQELRIASPQDRRFEYQAGIYLLRQEVRSNLRQRLGADASTYLLGPLAPPVVLDDVEHNQVGTTDVDSAAVFGQATWHLDDHVSVTAGLRYTHERREASNDAFVAEPGAPLDGLLIAFAPLRAAVLPALGGTFLVEDTRSDGSLSWLINPAWRINDAVLAYASVSYGEKSGAANLGARPGDPVIIDPEEVHDYAVGLKTTFWNGRAQFHPNLYWTEISDYHASVVDTVSTSARSYLGNVGEVRLRGVEVEGSLLLTDRFNVAFAAAYNDAIYRSYRAAPVPIEHSNTASATDLSGTRFPTAPRLSGQLSLGYEQPVGAWTVFGHANQTWRGDTFYHHDSEWGRQGGYALTNLGIGLRGASDRWSVQLWGRNVFDKRYALATVPAGIVFPYTAVLGEPRVFGLTVTLNAF